MSITQGMVVKLILNHIGGAKILGNASKVSIAGKSVVVKATGIAGVLPAQLGSVVSNLQGLGSISAITSSLQQNPLSGVLSEVSNIQSTLSSRIASISNIPDSVANTLSNSLTSLTSQLSNFQNHTNLLSGLVSDITTIPDSKLMLSDITSLGQVAMESLGMSKEDVLSTANSLFSTNTLLEISNSINPNVPGGASDIITKLATAADNGADETELLGIAQEFTTYVTDHVDTLQTLEDSDVSAQADLKLRVDTLNVLNSILPDPNNEIASTMFDLVSTDALKAIKSSLESTANTELT